MEEAVHKKPKPSSRGRGPGVPGVTTSTAGPHPGSRVEAHSGLAPIIVGARGYSPQKTRGSPPKLERSAACFPAILYNVGLNIISYVADPRNQRLQFRQSHAVTLGHRPPSVAHAGGLGGVEAL